jgi:hypothetical protein
MGREWPEVERVLLVGHYVLFAVVVAWDVGVHLHLHVTR